MKFIGMLSVAIATIVFSAMWDGYVLSILWHWFIVPTFHIVVLSIPAAIGLGIVVQMLTWKLPQEEQSDTSASAKMIRALAWSFGYPAFILLFGFIVHLFM